MFCDVPNSQELKLLSGMYSQCSIISFLVIDQNEPPRAVQSFYHSLYVAGLLT